MAQTIQVLKVSEEITSGQFVADVLDTAPPTGSQVLISQFTGAAAYSKTNVVKLVWKYNHATESEVILWSTKGFGESPQKIFITEDEGLPDGVRTLAVVCENAEVDDIVMSGYAFTEVTT